MSTTTFPAGSAASWELAVAVAKNIKAESSFIPDDGTQGEESTFEPDNRTKVNPKDFADGGKYRSIVKLQMRYKGQKPEDKGWAMGSGWLIRPDLLVTAGHCVFDHSRKYGPVIAIKAYIGYHGKKSIDSDKSVQFRQGKRIVTTTEWLSGPENRPNDVAFIQLDQPFNGKLSNFIYENTSTKGKGMLGVVGYPADKDLDNEKGALMYEEFANIAYDLSTSPRHMLAYKISTFGGQSGSPVLRNDVSKLTPIGAHVYGGGELNSASAIGGTYGNPYPKFIDAFSGQYSVIQELPNGVNIVRPGGTEAALESNGSDMEGFFDTLMSIAKIGGPILSNVLKIGSPFLGPIGGPIAAVAGVALNAISGKAESAESGESSESSESAESSEASTGGYAERAVLAEAALQTFMGIDPESKPFNQILGDMKSTYDELAPNLNAIAPKLVPLMMDPALRIAVHQVANPKPEKAESESAIVRPRLPLENAEYSESGMDTESEAFTKAMLAPTLLVPGQEGFFDSVGPLIQKGLAFGKPILRAAAKAGLNKLSDLLGSDGEASFESSENAQALLKLSHRAVMGEAALQALMKVPASQLKALKIKPQTESTESAESAESAEGFFDFFKDAVQTIGSTVLSVAPSVIKAVAPVALNLLKGSGESATEDTFEEQPKVVPPAKITPPKRTLEDVLRDAKNKANGVNGTVKVMA